MKPIQVKIDRAGRIVVPKPVRDELQLAPGDALELERLEDRLTLRPVRQPTVMRKKRGTWLFRAGEPLSAATVEQALDRAREEREKRVLESSR